MTDLLISGLVVAALVGVSLLVLRNSKQYRQLADVRAHWKEVDVAAVVNLLDPSEEQYLASRLSVRESNELHRARVAVAWEYFGNISSNTRLMVKACQILLSQNHPESAYLQQLVQSAMRFRIAILQAQMRLALCYLVPRGCGSLLDLVRNYGQLDQQLSRAMAFDSRSA
jgi:hypothetical protein